MKIYLSLFLLTTLTLIWISGCQQNLAGIDPEDAKPLSREHFSNNELAKRVLENDKVVILDFQATWCAPCQQLKPVLEQIHQSGQAEVVEIDVDQNPQMAQKFGAHSIPLLVFVKDGKWVTEMVGLQSRKSIENVIAQIDR